MAIEIDGVGYAVLMASPGDTSDLVAGFLRSERIVAEAGDIADIDVATIEQGTIARVALARGGADTGRARRRASDSSCGLCGVENLEQALRALPRVAARCAAGDAAVFAARAALDAHQALNRATGAVHAAALCAADGAIRLVREDVGRHNALDKLVGAMMRGGLDWNDGFALMSSRCSYELVEKAALAGCPMLATLSAPTSLALDRAAAAGLALRVLVRADAMLAPA